MKNDKEKINLKTKDSSKDLTSTHTLKKESKPADPKAKELVKKDLSTKKSDNTDKFISQSSSYAIDDDFIKSSKPKNSVQTKSIGEISEDKNSKQIQRKKIQISDGLNLANSTKLNTNSEKNVKQDKKEKNSIVLDQSDDVLNNSAPNQDDENLNKTNSKSKFSLTNKYNFIKRKNLSKSNNDSSENVDEEVKLNNNVVENKNQKTGIFSFFSRNKNKKNEVIKDLEKLDSKPLDEVVTNEDLAVALDEKIETSKKVEENLLNKEKKLNIVADKSTKDAIEDNSDLELQNSQQSDKVSKTKLFKMFSKKTDKTIVDTNQDSVEFSEENLESAKLSKADKKALNKVLSKNAKLISDVAPQNIIPSSGAVIAYRPQFNIASVFFRYFFSLIYKNKLIIVMSLLSIIGFVLTTFFILKIENTVKISMFSYSLILLIFPIAFLMFYLVGAFYVIFGKTKLNNVDLFNHIKPIKKWRVAMYKQFAILTFGGIFVAVNVIAFIATSMVVGLDVTASLIFSVSTLGSQIVVLILFCSIFFAIYVLWKPFTAFAVTSSIFVLVILGSIMPRFITNNSRDDFKYFVSADSNISYYNNYLKIYDINELTGRVNGVYNAIYYDSGGTKNRSGTFNQANKFDFFYNPFKALTIFGEVGWSTYEKTKLSENDFTDLFANRIKSQFATLQPQVKLESPFTFDIKNEPLIVSSDFVSIFDYNNKDELFDAIFESIDSNAFLQGNKTAPITDSQNNLWTLFKNKLSLARNWERVSLTELEKDFILHMTGLKESSRILFNLFYKNDLAASKMNGVKDFLISKYNSRIYEVLEFLWTDILTKDNLLYATDFIKSIDANLSLSLLHPELNISFSKIISSVAPSRLDANYLLGTHFQTPSFDPTNNNVISELKVLNTQGGYTTVPNPASLFAPEVNAPKGQAEWEEYIRNNPVGTLKNFLTRVDTSITRGNMKIFDFGNNVYDGINSLTHKVGLSVEGTNISFQMLYLIVLLGIGAGCAAFGFIRVQRGDLIRQ